jgi:hypothetical protein
MNSLVSHIIKGVLNNEKPNMQICFQLFISINETFENSTKNNVDVILLI